MDKSGWNTHCFGRFLIDLPPHAKVAATYEILGNEIKRLSDTPESLRSRVDARERELKGLKHETAGSMFVGRVNHEQGSVSLLSWRRSYGTSSIEMESYLVSSNKWGAFHYSGLIDSDRKDVAASNRNNLVRRMRSRENGELPTESGFCIDSGYVAGHEYMAESVSVDVTLPNHPGVDIEFWTGTGAEEDTLLDRIGGFFRTEVLGAATGIKTLRRGKRNVGPIKAEEYLVAATDKGQRVYSFSWESQGTNKSLSEPNMGAGLTVLERDVENDGSPPPPAFQSDEEALQLWDAIIESIRLRPGAI